MSRFSALPAACKAVKPQVSLGGAFTSAPPFQQQFKFNPAEIFVSCHRLQGSLTMILPRSGVDIGRPFPAGILSYRDLGPLSPLPLLVRLSDLRTRSTAHRHRHPPQQQFYPTVIPGHCRRLRGGPTSISVAELTSAPRSNRSFITFSFRVIAASCKAVQLFIGLSKPPCLITLSYFASAASCKVVRPVGAPMSSSSSTASRCPHSDATGKAVGPFL